jgi:hypothetical protein
VVAVLHLPIRLDGVGQRERRVDHGLEAARREDAQEGAAR